MSVLRGRAVLTCFTLCFLGSSVNESVRAA
jgi:hypothetical protein